MCIVLLSTVHPSYALILINNRDEYLGRPTAQADYWNTPHSHVLGGRDLLRPEHGTWLGLTSDGRLAVLTNFREDGPQTQNAVSRGAMVNAFLIPAPEEAIDTSRFVKELFSGERAKGSGGFSMVCGSIAPGHREGLAVVSNRMKSIDDVRWVDRERGETVGLSNAAFGDRSWNKVVLGEKNMEDTLRRCAAEGLGKDELIKELLAVLSDDTLPRCQKGEAWESYVYQLKESVFIPVVQGESPGIKAEDIATAESPERLLFRKSTTGAYGTQKQSVILVDFEGNVTYVEKTLYDEDGSDLDDSKSVRRFEFKIAKPQKMR